MQAVIRSIWLIAVSPFPIGMNIANLMLKQILLRMFSGDQIAIDMSKITWWQVDGV